MPTFVYSREPLIKSRLVVYYKKALNLLVLMLIASCTVFISFVVLLTAVCSFVAFFVMKLFFSFLLPTGGRQQETIVFRSFFKTASHFIDSERLLRPEKGPKIVVVSDQLTIARTIIFGCFSPHEHNKLR